MSGSDGEKSSSSSTPVDVDASDSGSSDSGALHDESKWVTVEDSDEDRQRSGSDSSADEAIQGPSSSDGDADLPAGDARGADAGGFVDEFAQDGDGFVDEFAQDGGDGFVDEFAQDGGDGFVDAFAQDSAADQRVQSVQRPAAAGLTSVGGNYGGLYYSSEFEAPGTTLYRNWAEQIWDIYSTQKRMEAEYSLHAAAHAGTSSGGSDGEEAASTSAKDTERDSDSERDEVEASITTGGADDVRERTLMNAADEPISPRRDDKSSDSDQQDTTSPVDDDAKRPGDVSAGDSAIEVIGPSRSSGTGRISLGDEESGTASEDDEDSNIPPAVAEEREEEGAQEEPADVPSATPTPRSRHCVSCREPMSSQAKFCVNCGTKALEDDDEDEDEPAAGRDGKPRTSLARVNSSASNLTAKFEAWERSESAKKIG
jgi:hypothetical protein